jgi:hypothetical protein
MQALHAVHWFVRIHGQQGMRGVRGMTVCKFWATFGLNCNFWTIDIGYGRRHFWSSFLFIFGMTPYVIKGQYSNWSIYCVPL